MASWILLYYDWWELLAQDLFKYILCSQDITYYSDELIGPYCLQWSMFAKFPSQNNKLDVQT